MKFTERGEVNLRIDREPDTGGAGRLHGAVEDTGIGIPPEKQARIFEAFSQADSSTTRRFGGTGLGLTISRRLLELMGGRLWLDSASGQGSTFHFTVPYQEAPEPPGTPPDLAGVAALVVDDNRTNRRILEETLLSWSMRPSLAENAAEAMALLTEAAAAGRPYPLILLDAHMPGTDGFALAARIRRELPGAIVMMLSSAGQPADVERCRKLGIAAYLAKPVGQSALRTTILSVLGRATGQVPAPPAPAPPPGGAREPLRILVAEDNPVNQKVATGLLRKRGYSVEVAANGRQALEQFRQGGFALILMDVQMPEMDGLETTAAIRDLERQSGGHTPIIALTAHAIKTDQDRCLAAGMDGYLAKPIRAAELFGEIDRLLPAGRAGHESALK